MWPIFRAEGAKSLSAPARPRRKWLIPGLAGALACASFSTLAVPAVAAAAECGPGALGTSRTIVVDPTEHPRIGTMQYHETLPLKDHEVVLTFDDGPLPAYSNKVLETLANECVKATFFIIGRMARQFPEGVRKLRDAGHTIGTHSENHPLSFDRMPVERAMGEINDGIAHTQAALGNPADLSPFFRIPGLLRAEGVETYLASRGLQTWSADFPADDWRKITSAQVMNYALTRLEAKGKGILLLHDIQARTAEMLPKLLRELKARGFRVVHVVAATPQMPKTPTTAEEWLMHPAGPAVASTRWPKVPTFRFTAAGRSAIPDIRPAEMRAALGTGRSSEAGAKIETAWPTPIVLASADALLPVPDKAIYRPWKIPGARSKVAATQAAKPVRVGTSLYEPAQMASAPRANAAMAAAPAAVKPGHKPLPGSYPVTTVGLSRGGATTR